MNLNRIKQRAWVALGCLRGFPFTSAPVVDTPPLHHCHPIGHHIWNPTALHGRLPLCPLSALDLPQAAQGAPLLLQSVNTHSQMRIYAG